MREFPDRDPIPEAVLQGRSAQAVRQRKRAAELLAGLHVASVLVEPAPARCRYQPGSDALHLVNGRVADCYSRHLMPVTQLIHSKTDKRAQQFADTFKLREDI